MKLRANWRALLVLAVLAAIAIRLITLSDWSAGAIGTTSPAIQPSPSIVSNSRPASP